MGYVRPTDLTTALAHLAEREWTVLAGGTDLYPATVAQHLGGDVLDINGLDDLRGISEADDGWRIGARTTWTDVVRADLPPAFQALQQAAREVGSVQIQNSGTLAGNICNASPAADGVPALLVLDAEVELSAQTGRRTLPLGDFLTGPRSTALAPVELVTAVIVPRRSAQGVSTFAKLGARKYLVISIAMAAVRMVMDGGRIADAAVSIGACSAVAVRLTKVERVLVGAVADATTSDLIQNTHVAADLSPIDDVRGTAAYRVQAATELVRRAVAQVLAP
ncbi:MAG: xanthine dehydrogenase family protein subunit M [Pseudomonadota bacterium]